MNLIERFITLAPSSSLAGFILAPHSFARKLTQQRRGNRPLLRIIQAQW